VERNGRSWDPAISLGMPAAFKNWSPGHEALNLPHD
jgi:hypothetical protein